MKRSLLTSALIAGLVATPAFAASGAFELSVKFDRTALGQSETVAAEYENIREQVEDSCSAELTRLQKITKSHIVNRCVDRTMDSTVAKIDIDALTEHHAQAKSE